MSMFAMQQQVKAQWPDAKGGWTDLGYQVTSQQFFAEGPTAMSFLGLGKSPEAAWTHAANFLSKLPLPQQPHGYLQPR